MGTSLDRGSIRVKVSFRVFGLGIDPDAVAAAIGREGDHEHRVGDPIASNPAHVYKHNMWLLNSKSPPEAPLEVHLDELLAIVEGKQAYVRSLAEHATVDFACTVFWDNGFELTSRTMRRIGELGAAFGVVVYPDDSEGRDSNTPMIGG